jgi:hypothetical protein
MGRHRVIGGGKVSLDFTAAPTPFISTGSPMTFPSVPIGAAGKRHVILALWVSGNPILSVTIGGVAASLIHSGSTLQFWGASVPTGTTANIVVTYSGSAGLISYATWAAYGLKSLTEIDSGTNLSTIAGDTLSSKPRGCAFALATDVCPFDESPGTFSMSGMTIDAQPPFTGGTPRRRMMFASALTTSTSIAYSISPIANSTGTGDQIISISLR